MLGEVLSADRPLVMSIVKLKYSVDKEGRVLSMAVDILGIFENNSSKLSLLVDSK